VSQRDKDANRDQKVSMAFDIHRELLTTTKLELSKRWMLSLTHVANYENYRSLV
jgi:hypothetical protein